MSETFFMKVDEIQPSQLFISTQKLAEVLRDFDPSRPDSLEPIPVTRLDDEVVIVDGHTRAFAAFLCGLREVTVFWDQDELDREAYRICVLWCKEAGVRTLSDLVGRLIGPADYERRWRKRCRKMHRELAVRRAREL